MSTTEENAIEKMIDIGGYRLCVQCAGERTPTVVIQAGLTEGLDPWAAMLPHVAAFTRVCAYDRAGVGKSDAGPKPRTSQQMVAELRTLLRNAQIEGPYVLVGHSLGGLNVQFFAAQYPGEVAGMVLIDSAFHDMLERFEPILREQWMAILKMALESDNEGITPADFVTSLAQVAAAGKIPDIPLVVLAAGQPMQLPPEFGAVAADYLRVMQAGQAAFVDEARGGRPI